MGGAAFSPSMTRNEDDKEVKIYHQQETTKRVIINPNRMLAELDSSCFTFAEDELMESKIEAGSGTPMINNAAGEQQ